MLLTMLFTSIGLYHAIPAAADGCASPHSAPSQLWNAIPPSVPPGVVVAEVEFPPGLSEAEFLRVGGAARIIRFHRGTFAGATIHVRPGNSPACARPFADGRRGIIMARFEVDRSGPVLELLWAPRRQAAIPRPRPSIKRRQTRGFRCGP